MVLDVVWGGACPTYLAPLIILQKKIIRVIAGERYQAHSSPLFARLKMLKVVDINKFQVSRYVFNKSIIFGDPF